MVHTPPPKTPVEAIRELALKPNRTVAAVNVQEYSL
jgi:hypothetical protein